MANEMVIANNNDALAVSGNNFNRDGMGGLTHFFDTSTPKGKMALYNAMQTSGRIEDHLNETLHVKNALAQAIEVANTETGEINHSTRVVLHAEEGDFAAASDTLAHSLGNLFSIFGTPNQWSEPLTLRVVSKKSRRGYRYFDVEVVDDED